MGRVCDPLLMTDRPIPVSEDNEEPTWFESLPGQEQWAMETANRTAGLPSMVLALYARWWQLETWLRELAYVELRARDGIDWLGTLDQRVVNRQSRDKTRLYMTSPDWEDPMAYMDVGILFDLVEKEWDIIGPSLIDKDAWVGRRAELLAIRHRIGHLRRPHTDDLNRLEQTLRDLENGAKEALRSYNRRRTPPPGTDDGVAQAWVDRHHSEAHLISHAELQYGTQFYVQHSRRPWAEGGVLKPSGQPGYFWHAFFYTSRWIDLSKFWRSGYLDNGARKLAVHTLSDNLHELTVTFAAVDDPNQIADAIGGVFHAFLGAASTMPPPGYDPMSFLPTKGRRPPTDPRVLVDTAWNIVDDDTEPITIFAAH